MGKNRVARLYTIQNMKSLAAAILLSLTLLITSLQAQDMRARYERAAQHLPAQATKLMRNLSVDPVWIKGSDKFVYRRQLPNEEREFLLVDAASSSTPPAPAFDHTRLAAALEAASTKKTDPRKLPFQRLNSIDSTAVEFTAEGKTWRCTITSDYACTPVLRDPEEIPSPDGKWVAFTRNYNLYVRATTPDRREIALTRDGEKFYAYAAYAGGNNAVTDERANKKLPPLLAWSPDSKRLLTCRTDERHVGSMYLLQSVPDQPWPEGSPRRPLIHSYKYPLPGDENMPRKELIVFDIDTGARTNLRIPPLVQHGPEHQSPLATIFASKQVLWNPDSTTVYAAELARDQRSLRFWSANAKTGEATVLVEEKSPTYVEYAVPAQLLAKRKQFLWWSERSGWGHLYLYDLTNGKLIRAVTSGDWVVRSVTHVDEESGHVYLSGSGKEGGDPWIQSLYRADLSTAKLDLLTQEKADHAAPATAAFSPSGAYFVETYSRIDSAPVSVLRGNTGALVRELERADVSAYNALNAPPPKAFAAKARDGKTDIYGTLHYPSDFDPKKKYPVLDSDYPGPQTIKAPKRYQGGSVEQATAELGFIVVQIDGLGKPWRSKAYHDYAYANMGDTGGLEDHIAALRQIVKDHPYLDLSNVGIFGHSGGGFASARAMLMFPDFYKVAVSSAGNHDQLGYLAAWGEKYQGPVNGRNFDNQDTALLAANLKGKLLLAYGDMDDNVHPGLTVRLIDALTKANKDYDLIVMPNRNHSFAVDPYFNRRRWDYFVKHLLHLDPPQGFELKAVIPPPEQ